MNLLHMKYAVEIAETNSINKAAETLCVGQPNLSRAIKELEAGLGLTLFDRSSKGMTLTPEGEIFVKYAKNILQQVDEVEQILKTGTVAKKRFSVSAPRASYIADGFAKFSNLLDPNDVIDLFYMETNSRMVIQNMLQDDYRLGIVRYAENNDKYYKKMLDEKNFAYELVAEFNYVLLMNRDCPLAYQDVITLDDLSYFIQVAHADPYVPSVPYTTVSKEEISEDSSQRIFVFERGSQFELMSQNNECFMWVSPVPQEILDRYNLVQRRCAGVERPYKDVLIHKKDYTLTKLDQMFIEQMILSKRRIIDNPIISPKSVVPSPDGSGQ